MGIKRMVDMSFWTDSKVDEFSPEDKYFMLYILTNPFTTQLGIYEISIKQAAFQMGWSVDAFNVLLDRFENKYHMILYSKSTGEIAIKNFLRHSVIKGGKPVEDCIRKEMSKVKNKKLIDYVFRSLHGRDDLNETVKKIVTNYINENDNDNDNENETTVDVSCDDSCHDSYYHPPEPPKAPKDSGKKPTKHKYGEYQNVLLTDEELEKLQNEYIDWVDKIENLSSYMASKGKSYKSHYATIRNWARKDAEKQNTGSKGKTADMLDDSYKMMQEWAGGSNE